MTLYTNIKFHLSECHSNLYRKPVQQNLIPDHFRWLGTACHISQGKRSMCVK